jgi:hypothetical protein
LSWWLLTLSACRRALMVFRTSQLGPRRLLTADAAAPPLSPHTRCWEGGGFWPWADGAPTRPHSEQWREAELSACCAAAASSSAFSCWHTRRSSEVAASRHPPEEWQSISVGVGVDVRALVGALVVVACRPARRWCWCAAVRLVGSRTVLASVVVPLVGLLLHRNVLCRSSIAGLGIHAQLLVKKGYLLVELASCLREFVESRLPLGVSGAVAQSRLRFGAARCGGHAEVALPRGVMSSRSPCPPSHCRP